MRIISGKHKGRRISPPKHLPVRPTTDMAKESLFNILANRFYFGDLKIFDLFSGTGNIAIEFASRDAGEIVAVDNFPACVGFIAKTARELDLPIHALRSDVFKFLESTPERADIIFIDPPYGLDDDRFMALVALVFDRGLLRPGGLLIVEHSANTDLSTHPRFSEIRKYGGSRFSFFVPSDTEMP